ncbi:MAG: phosphoribosylglycinamide formyltransferase [Raineya sp.]|nr:phosphoribosylglycinamide formyltransferase [Raineya sp.]
MTRIALFASGGGSNAENIIRYFQNHSSIEIACLLSNKKDAYALERAKNLEVTTYTFNRADFYESTVVLDILKKEKIDWVVLAGFLWLVPESLVEAYENKIINIHPALLPKYGGKGMYGEKVHEAVWQAQEKETGITIHYVNSHYDEGKVIFQATTALSAQDTPESIAKKVHTLEYEHFPKVIEKTVLEHS